MEDENQVFGKDAEAVDSNINLESEDFNFYNQNKEEARRNIESSSEDLSDFIDSLIRDIPDPSDEDVDSGIKKILEKTHLSKKHPETNKKKKVTFKVLFIAALLSVLSFSCFFAVGSSHNVSIENGFVTFAKDTIKIVFSGEDKEEYITVDTLLTDLKAHGYDDILFPQVFITKSDEYKVTVPEYYNDGGRQVSFDICASDYKYAFSINDYQNACSSFDFLEVDNAKTVKVNGIYVYIFYHDNNSISVQLADKQYRYNIHVYLPYSDVLKTIKTLTTIE